MIRKAQKKDIPFLNKLLSQVDLVHHKGRPDLFKIGNKYSDEQLAKIIEDQNTPILVCVDELDRVLGYCFCIFIQHVNNSILTDVKTLYIDDLCVDENIRGKGVGKKLYDSAVKLAKENGCYNLTLNVWSCNQNALKFYQKCGLVPQKIGMEKIL